MHGNAFTASITTSTWREEEQEEQKKGEEQEQEQEEQDQDQEEQELELGEGEGEEQEQEQEEQERHKSKKGARRLTHCFIVPLCLLRFIADYNYYTWHRGCACTYRRIVMRVPK